MNKVIHLSLARKSVPILMDVVQSATAPSIEFVLDDYTPPSNARARIYIKKDGGEVYNNCTLSGNVVTYTPTAGSFDVAGQCVAQLELVQGSTVAVSWRIFVTVEPNLINGSAAPASTEYGALTQLIVNAQRYDSIIGANNITGYNNRQGWIVIPNGADLNTYTEPGIYHMSSSDAAPSIVNKPSSLKRAFKMVVERSINSNPYIAQTIYPLNMTVSYKRFSSNNGSTWTEWELQPSRSEVDAIANSGAKNLLQHLANSKTENGVTFTKNADGSVTVNGTATQQVGYIVDIAYNDSYANGKSLLLTGCPSGGSSSTYRLVVIRDGGTTVASDTGEGSTFTADATRTYRTQIAIYGGTTVNNLTFYPMIRDASIQDDTYVPYGMSNAELTEQVRATNATYTPTFEVTAGSVTIANISFAYSQYKNFGIIRGRFNLTAKTDGNSTLNISLPPTFPQCAGSVGMAGSILAPDGNAELMVRLDGASNQILVVRGADGNYSLPVLTTGYYGIFVFVPFVL